MPKLKVVFLAAALTAGGGIAGANAMPISNLGGVDLATNAEPVRWVCSPYSGRCWWRPSYGYRPYAFYGGPRFYGYRSYGGRGGWRGGWRGRRW